MATYTIITTINPTDKGTVKIGSVNAKGPVQEEGVEVNLLASPISGWRFISFEIESVLVSTEPTYSFIMPSNDVNLTANFEAIPDLVEPSNDLYDTTCPKFLFVENMFNRVFVGDVVDFTVFNTTQIPEEPIGFDSAVFELRRDEDYHGFNYDLTLDSLTFERGNGYEFLLDKLITSSIDADVKFVFGYGDISALTVVYIGRFDFNEFEQNNSEEISLNLINDDFGSLLNNSFDIPQRAELPDTTLLRSKALPRVTQYLFPYPEFVVGTNIPIFNPIVSAYFAEAYRSGELPEINKTHVNGYLYFNDGRQGDDDFESFFTYDFQVEDINPFVSPDESQKYVFKVSEAGFYTTKIKLKLGVNTNGVVWGDYQNPFQLFYVVTAPDGETIIRTETLNPTVTEVTDSFLEDVYLEYVTEWSDDLAQNQLVYVYIAVDVTAFPTGGVVKFIYGRPFNFDKTIPQIDIVAHTIVADSFCKTAPTLSVLNDIFKAGAEIDYDPIDSSLFDAGGCLEGLLLTNGFNVRGGVSTNASEDQLKIKTAPKDLFESLSAVLNLGWGIEYDALGNERIRIESTNYFYQNVSILSLDENFVSNFKLRIKNTAFYNELEIGYSKYSKPRDTDKSGTLGDVHTKHIYQLPVKTNKNKKSIISDIVMSATELEHTRRKQFSKNSSSTNSNYNTDEDVFGIMITDATESSPSQTATIPNSLIIEEGPFNTRAKNGTNPSIQMTLVPFTVGEVVTYSGSDGTVQIRTVSFYNTTSELVYDVLTNTYVLLIEVNIGFAEAYTGGTGSLPIFIIKQASAETYTVPESTEPFEIVTDVISPTTFYNLRFTPKRMLLNWGSILNGSFRALNDRIIKFIQGDGNISCVTKLKDDETCLLGDIDIKTVVEGGDLDLDEGSWGTTYLFTPVEVEFDYPLTFEEHTLIRNAVRGRTGSVDYGFLTVPFCGGTYEVFITDMKYNPTQEYSSITGILKSLD